jgi:hypothetical protein
MDNQTNSPAPHAGEKEAPAIPKNGETPGMGAPAREPGTRPDGEAMPPDSIDPKPDGNDMSELDDPMDGSPDKEAGRDDRRQRPITDNKAGD